MADDDDDDDDRSSVIMFWIVCITRVKVVGCLLGCGAVCSLAEVCCCFRRA